MRRVSAWFFLCVFGVLLSAVSPQAASAQPAQAPAEDPAKPELGHLGADLRGVSAPSLKALGLDQAHALLVVLAPPGGPADRAGLRPGDVIVTLDGATVGTARDFLSSVEQLGAGREVTLDVLRGTGRLAVSATLGRRVDAAAPSKLREERIAAYQTIVRLLDPAILAYEWGASQHSLGAAYEQRALGDRADNLEKAIAAFEAALTVRTREAMPRDWASTQHSLGSAYRNRIRGDPASNQEKAIAAFEAALTVATREAMPREWSITQNSLAIAYAARVRGNRADNMEKAIAAYEAALAIRTREALPREWALTQDNLATAYAVRVHGNRADNLESAIAAFQSALTVRTREALPREWASTQNSLGNVYGRRIRGSRADNLEKAIAAYEAALTISTREALPREWSGTQNNLGNVYRNRIRGDRASNLEKAIAAYEAALTIRSREALPSEWAQTQGNLGVAYRNRIRGDRDDNLQKAIVAFEGAFAVMTREAVPREHLSIGRMLGAALSSARQWDKAGSVYASARETFLQLFGQGLNDAEARSLIDQAGSMFAEAAFAAVERGELEAALELANEGRARQLRVALRRQALELPAEKRPRYYALTAELRGWEEIAEDAKDTDFVAALEKVAALRQQLSELTAPHLPKEVGLRGDVIPEGGAVVVPIVTGLGGKLLIMTAGGDGPSIVAIDLPQLDRDRLNRVMRGDAKGGGWLGAYRAQQQDQLRWLAAIDGLGLELWELLGAAMDRGLKGRGLKPGARVAVLPTAALGLLPLGLAQDPGSGRRLAETWEIVQAPSFEALAIAHAQAAEPTAPSLAAAINPTGDLPFTEVEGTLVAARFAGRPQLKLDTSVATADLVVAALKGKSYWHFASHGAFDWNDARQSGLVMREGERLTVGRLIEAQGTLGRPRLVVLSACETGLYDIGRNPDEFVGLPAAFMQTGAAGVVGSLWLVDDLATALLMAKLYDLHLGSPGGSHGGGLAPPTALRQAQAWLRDSTRAELTAYAKTAAGGAKIDRTRLAELDTVLARGQRSASSRFAGIWEALKGRSPSTRSGKAEKRKPAPAAQARPFQHPFFWAGFVYTGL